MSDEFLPEIAYAFLDAAAVKEEPEPANQLVVALPEIHAPENEGWEDHRRRALREIPRDDRPRRAGSEWLLSDVSGGMRNRQVWDH